MSQIHIHAQPGEVAPYVLLPGDPKRARFIAENFFDEPRLYSDHRGLLGFTGTYRGVPVSVQTTGMGCPTTAIVVEELIRLGTRTLVRVGTAGVINREVEPGEMVVISKGQVDSQRPFTPARSRFCIFEHVYFSRPDSIYGSHSVYETRRQIGVELAREAPVEADLVCPVPDSGTPAAIGYAQESGIPFGLGIIRSQYVGRTFIEPTEQIRDMGVRLKLNVNKALVAGKRIVLVDDSVVRGTTSRKVKDMILEAGAKEVHFRIASPPTAWPCFYGVDTPERAKLLAAQMTPAEMRDWIGVDSLAFVSLDGLYRALGEAGGRDNANPQYCDACFSGDYPVTPTDRIAQGFQMKKPSEAAE